MALNLWLLHPEQARPHLKTALRAALAIGLDEPDLYVLGTKASTFNLVTKLIKQHSHEEGWWTGGSRVKT